MVQESIQNHKQYDLIFMDVQVRFLLWLICLLLTPIRCRTWTASRLLV
jgi:hypothetical protein